MHIRILRQSTKSEEWNKSCTKSTTCIYTTGLALFAECRIHSAKALLHSAKGLPSVALGKPHSVKKVTAKAPLPSVFFRTLGKLFETGSEKQHLKIPKKFYPVITLVIHHDQVGCKSRCYFALNRHFAVAMIRTRDLCFTRSLLYHSTPASHVSRYHFYFSHTILTRD